MSTTNLFYKLFIFYILYICILDCSIKTLSQEILSEISSIEDFNSIYYDPFKVDNLVATDATLDNSTNIDISKEAGEDIIYPRNITMLFKGSWTVINGSLEEFKFTQKSGVILFSASNLAFTAIDSNNSTSSTSNNSSPYSFDKVEGELVFRDGIYLNVEYIRFYLYGIYEYQTGLLSTIAIPALNRYGYNISPINFTTAIENGKNQSEILDSIKLQMSNIANNVTMVDFNVTQNVILTEEQQQEYQSMIFVLVQQFNNVTEEFNLQTLPPNYNYEHDEKAVLWTQGQFYSIINNVYMNFNSSNIVMSDYKHKWMNYVVMVTLQSFVQIIVLLKQIDYSGTQSGASKVSMITIGIQTILDAYLCLFHLSVGILIDSMFNAFATAAFFEFVTFSLMEMRFLLIILKANRPQAFAEGWASLRREFSLFYLRFYTCLITSFIILYYYFSTLFTLFLFIMYSFWVPQIIMNAQKSIRKPYLWKYVLGTSISRLLIPLYFFGCPNNFIPLKPDFTFSVLLVLWVAIQVAVLYLQSIWGPQFFIPKRFLPQRYQYYRPISQAIKNRGDLNCVICMNDVEEAHEYLITPCEHIFHSKCLKDWADYKLECPVCRNPLPIGLDV
ncbi:hypothetical protein DLAC_00901 [Tieghemostelium lacteum]|uniref:RING-type E3 ubiquitin transferase n=1 Tax=Tieghemostelium lacteum TaxID=361077 RepID=A0A152A781_TIELA|nr:hypothetical protein DLAC_00901 [Tieghemostelium lacteum]|eukprot:KYR02102.1 hypothetical protein DLAC_00901 [Tieghemostelium lacteum]